MPKLNQVIAVVPAKKKKCTEGLTALYKLCQQPTIFDGLLKTYLPDDEEGETHPSETKRVQITAFQIVDEGVSLLTELLDVVYTQDCGNTQACSDIIVKDINEDGDGKILATGVPVTYLLFLEKQLIDIHTLIKSLPVLSPIESWTFDDNSNCYKSDPTITNRAQKVRRNHVKAEATEQHPAQVEMYNEDVKVGEWTTVKISGAIAAKQKAQILQRVRQVQEAVKIAREEANSSIVEPKKVGQGLLNYIVG